MLDAAVGVCACVSVCMCAHACVCLCIHMRDTYASLLVEVRGHMCFICVS